MAAKAALAALSSRVELLLVEIKVIISFDEKIHFIEAENNPKEVFINFSHQKNVNYFPDTKNIDLNPWKLSWLPLPRNYVRLNENYNMFLSLAPTQNLWRLVASFGRFNKNVESKLRLNDRVRSLVPQAGMKISPKVKGPHKAEL